MNPEKPEQGHESNTSDDRKTGYEGEKNRVTPVAQEKGKVSGDTKAPQTYDPGVAAPTGLAALASGLLVALERFKRRKRD